MLVYICNCLKRLQDQLNTLNTLVSTYEVWLLQLLALLCDPYRRVYFKCKIDHEYCVADIN